MSGYENDPLSISIIIILYVGCGLGCLIIIVMHIVRDTAVKRPNREAKFSTRSTLKQFMVK